MVDRLPELRRARGVLVTARRALTAEYVGIVNRADEDTGVLPDEDVSRLDTLQGQIDDHDSQIRDHEDRITRAETALGYEQENSEPVDDAERAAAEAARRAALPGGARRTPASARRGADYDTEPSLIIGGLCRMMAAGGGNVLLARQASAEIMGENNPVTRALRGEIGYSSVDPQTRAMMVGVGPSGGFIVPPDYVADLIEILRPMTVVRDGGPRTIEMPRGTMQMPKQTQAATAAYGSETAAIPVSQQAVGQIVATYKKLTAMTPITNDLMRYSSPSVDSIVRDDLAQILARREDLAFIRGDGTQDSPKGFKTFCLSGNLISSNASYTLATAASELGGALNKIESANVPMSNLIWIMHPRVKNYLLNVQNSNGFYVWREEMIGGTLLGWPFKTTTQIPINLSSGGNNDCSEIYLVAMGQAMLFDSMRLELAVSREASYIDANSNVVSSFQSDQTLVRAIAEHDFHMRHDEAVAMIQNVRYAPAIS